MHSKTNLPTPAVPTQGKKLMDQVGDALRTRNETKSEKALQSPHSILSNHLRRFKKSSKAI
jgi:hypothetical protein